jgi:hypothetical protein
MTTSTLLEKQFEEKIHNEDLLLTDVWEKSSSESVIIPSVSLINETISIMKNAEEMICITSDGKLPKALLLEIANLSKKGIRFYILLKEYHSEYESFFTKNALVRVDTQINGFMLLIDAKTGLNNKSGYLFAHNSFELEKSALIHYFQLNGNQLKEALHYFQWKFWESMEEYRGGQMALSNQLRPPFDILPLLDPDEYYFNTNSKSYLIDRVSTMIDAARVSIRLSLSDYKEYDTIFDLLNEKAESGVLIYLYTDFSQDHLFIKRFESSKNIHIFANDRLNTYFLLIDDKTGLFLTGSIENTNETGIQLHNKEVQDFLSNLEYQKDDFWKYHQEISLGKVKGEAIIRERYDRKAVTSSIENQMIVNQGEFEAKSLREYFEGSFIPVRTTEPILARQLVYLWKLTPKFREQNSKLDSIYEQWEKEIKKIKGYTNDVLQYALATKEEKKDLLSSFIGRFITNKEDKLNSIVQELEMSLKRLETKKNKDQLLTIIASIKNHSQHLVEEKLELTEKKHFHQEKQKWEDQKKQLVLQQLELLKTIDLMREKQEQLQLSKDAKQGVNDVETIMLQEKLQELELEMQMLMESHQEFFQKYSIEKTILEICKELDEKIKKFDKLKQKKKKNYFQKEVEPAVISKMEEVYVKPIYDEIMSICNITDSKARMSYLKKELATHSELRASGDSDKDLITKYSDLENEKTAIELQLQEKKKSKNGQDDEFVKEEKALEKELEKQDNELRLIERKIEKLGEEFIYSSKTQDTQLPFSLNPSFSLPNEELPNTGVLYKIGKTRQLAIKEQAQLDLGEKEAERLHAELVLDRLTE